MLANTLTGKGISAEIDWTIGFAKLTSITAHRTRTDTATLDVECSGADLSNQTTSDTIKTLTHEFRLASNSYGRFNWLRGASYSDEKVATGRTSVHDANARAFADAVTRLPRAPILIRKTIRWRAHHAFPSLRAAAFSPDRRRARCPRKLCHLSATKPAAISKWSANLPVTYTQAIGARVSAVVRGEFVYPGTTPRTDIVPATIANAEAQDHEFQYRSEFE